MQKVLRPALLSLIFLMIIALTVVMGGVIGWDAGWFHLADDHATTISRDHVSQVLSPDNNRPYFSVFPTYHGNDNAG